MVLPFSNAVSFATMLLLWRSSTLRYSLQAGVARPSRDLSPWCSVTWPTQSRTMKEKLNSFSHTMLAEKNQCHQCCHATGQVTKWRDQCFPSCPSSSIFWFQILIDISFLAASLTKIPMLSSAQQSFSHLEVLLHWWAKHIVLVDAWWVHGLECG